MDEELIAVNIKRLRKKRKMTLERLAESTGLTKGYLSRIERSKKAPPYSTLSKIALALGVDVSFMLDGNLPLSPGARISFTRKNERKRVENIGLVSEGSLYGYKYEALAFNKQGKNMEPYIIEPAFDDEAVFQHEGEEFMYVLRGEHELVYGGEKYLMHEGDSVYFDAGVPHTGRSLGKEKARLLAVMFNYKR